MSKPALGNQPIPILNDSIELIGGDPAKCQRLSTVPELDTEYPAFISLNRESNTLTYHFSGRGICLQHSY